MSTQSAVNSSSPDRIQIATQLMTAWLESLVTVLESMTGCPPKVESHASSSGEVGEGWSWWGESLSILEGCGFWIGAPAESWVALGRLTLSALGVDEASDSDIESTCRDLLAQTTCSVADRLTRQLEKEVTGGDSIPNSQPDGDDAVVFLWSLDAGTASVEGRAIWSGALLAQCGGLAAQPLPGAASSAEAPPASGSEMQEIGGRSVNSIPRLDLKVSFVLGRTTLPLRDVFKLNIGSVIELDHSAVAPADVVIRGRVIGRGQVVVVNGNYGLKILPHQD